MKRIIKRNGNKFYFFALFLLAEAFLLLIGE